MDDWPQRIRAAIVTPQTLANEEAGKTERKGRPQEAITLRLFGRLNGIEDGLIELSMQIEDLRAQLGTR